MDIENATADALVSDTPMADVTPDAPVDAMAEARAIWDRRETEQETEEAPAVEAGETEAPAEAAPPEPEVQETPQVVDPPSDMPWQVKEHWDSIPESAREGIIASQREMAMKNNAMGRQVQALKPFQDGLVELAQKRPQMRDMTPAQILAHSDQIMTWGDRLATDFDGAQAEIHKAYGREYTPGKAQPAQPAGQEQTALESALESVRRENAEMRQQLSQINNPEYIQNLIAERLAHERMVSQIDEFATGKENWDEAYQYFDLTAPMARAKLGDSASAQDVLAEAYNIAVQTFVSPPVAPQASVAEQAAPKVDPGRAQAAKSINVKSDQASSPKPLTARQEAKRIWDARNS